MASVFDPDQRPDWMISVDDHVLEPAGTWQDRVPAKFKDMAPKLVRDDLGEAWYYEGKRFAISGLAAVAGKTYDEISPEAQTYDDMRPGCYDPVARLADMDVAGVIASVNFPSFPRFCGQAFMEAEDQGLGLLCVQAWNDWMIDEWCAAAPGRYIPATLIPLWDVQLAVKEIERCAAKGTRGVIFSENPNKLLYKGEPLPSIHDAGRYWDPLFAALQDAEIPLLMHYGSSSNMQLTSKDAPYLISLTTNSFTLPISTTADWIFSGVLGRYPKLQVCMSESQIGWVAPLLERAEYVYKIQGPWNNRMTQAGTMADHARGNLGIITRDKPLFEDERSPTQIFKEQIFCCFFEDFVGVRDMKALGFIDNMLIEMDYPHSDSTWPNSIERAREQVEPLTDHEAYQVMIGNAMRIHRFEPAAPAVPAGV